MTHHKLILFILTLLTATGVYARSAYRSWIPDILGDSITMRYVTQPDDYRGHVRSTIIRRLAHAPSTKGVLYVHGFNDYFFQKEEAKEFNRHGYNFYAVDLRKYGRSLLPGQKRTNARDMSEYFADIDSALVQMKRDGQREIILMGHSTGGLLCAYYMATSIPPVKISALILNSPFMDWNLGKIEWLVPSIRAIGRILPDFPIPQSKNVAYGESLLKKYHGEWTYNEDWKSVQSPNVTAGWVRAVENAQNYLQKADHPIHIPILLMFSSHGHNVTTWDPMCNNADVVLDPGEIRKYGVLLGTNVTSVKVVDGMHDLFLSKPGVRKAVYDKVFQWLSKNAK